MTLRTALVIDGDNSGAAKAAGQTAADLKRLEQAAERAAREATRATERVRAQAAMLRQNVLFQLNDIGVSLASGMNPLMVAIQQGSQLATGPGGLGGALKEVGNIAVGLVTKFWPIGAAVAAVSLGLAGLQKEINRTGTGIEVSFGDTALAVLQTFGDYIWDVIGPAVTAFGTWFDDNVWPVIVKGATDTVNVLVRGWMGFLAELELIGTSITHIFDDTWVVIQNGAVAFLQELTDSVMRDVNALRRAFGQDPIEVKLDFLLADGNGNWSGEALDKFRQRMAAINGTDYAGKLFGDIADHARQNALNRQDDDDKKAKGLERITKAVREQRTALDELADAGSSAFDRLTDTILSGGKDIMSTLQSIAGDFAKLAFQMAITNPLKNALFGGNAATFGGGSVGAGGLFGSLFGVGGLGGLKSSPGLGGLTGSVMSFAGGGGTGSGARAGGLDGQGGFLAMLHPRETVVDHAAGGNGGVIRIVLQDDSGRMADIASQQIRTASGAIVEVAVERSNRKFHDQAARGSLRPYGVGPALKRS